MQAGRRRDGDIASIRRRAARRSAVLVVALAMLLSACTAEPQPSRPYPEALVEQLATLRQATGLFTRPDPRGDELSLYSTALYAADGQLPWKVDLGAALTAGSSEAAATGPTLYTWAAVRLSGATRAAPRALPHLTGVDLGVPQSTGNPEQDIGLLWAWADAASRTVGVPAADRAEVRRRLEDVDLGRVRAPYPLWRLSAALRLVGAQIGGRLAAAISNAAEPRQSTAVTDVLDLQGWLELDPRHGSPSLRRTLERRLDSLSAGDDLLASSLARSIRLLGGSTPQLQHELERRRDRRSGLLRRSETVLGSVEATYLVARLVSQDFPKIAPEATRAALVRFLSSSPDAARIDRLRAVAALRLSGDPRWTDYRPEVVAAAGSVRGATVTRDSLLESTQLIEVLRVLDYHLPKPTLERFEPRDAEGAYLARIALSDRDMFADRSAIGHWFPGVQREIISGSLAPTEPLRLYYSGLTALAGAQDAAISPGQQTRISAALRPLRGCTRFPDLYRSAIADRTACSLEATRFALDSGFAEGEDR